MTHNDRKGLLAALAIEPDDTRAEALVRRLLADMPSDAWIKENIDVKQPRKKPKATKRKELEPEPIPIQESMIAEMAANSIIGYIRVSTDQQGISGLGLEGQLASIQAFAKQRGAALTHTYTEVESGTRTDNRPELAKALSHAKRSKSTLVVAKIDRLSRNLAFLSAFLESGVEFACVDLPNANRLTLQVMSMIAEQEAKAISERTTTALAALKARGVKLGSARPGHWDGREHLRMAGLVKARAASATIRRGNADAAYEDLLPLMQEMRDGGATLTSIAQRLNDDGQTTRNGKTWRPVQVGRVLGEDGYR